MLVSKNNTALLQSNSLSLSAHSEENRSQKACMLLSRNHRDLPVEEVCYCKRKTPDAKYIEKVLHGPKIRKCVDYALCLVSQLSPSHLSDHSTLLRVVVINIP